MDQQGQCRGHCGATWSETHGSILVFFAWNAGGGLARGCQRSCMSPPSQARGGLRQGGATVDHKGLAGDVAGGVGGQEQHRGSDIGGFPQSPQGHARGDPGV
ncbi:hypothetical protein WR25_04089 [Diploscapter pachys]|uniref:Uncharacterized protein n=1 Tax=Diploscapter pachys TaxID=2018661 RepID=A0A2A2M5N4_9BILA|nr:hypothetical protein WR25_04089 [Diploscapter pachys]